MTTTTCSQGLVWIIITHVNPTLTIDSLHQKMLINKSIAAAALALICVSGIMAMPLDTDNFEGHVRERRWVGGGFDCDNVTWAGINHFLVKSVYCIPIRINKYCHDDPNYPKIVAASDLVEARVLFYAPDFKECSRYFADAIIQAANDIMSGSQTTTTPQV